jgi:hypothetical protein
MLTRQEAHQLLLERLKLREGGDPVVAEDRTLERPFGWLFFVAQSVASATARAEDAAYRPVIVNKHVKQIVASSIDYTPERFIEIYETLLAKSQAQTQQWCLSVSLPLPWTWFGRDRLRRRAKDGGLYEIK